MVKQTRKFEQIQTSTSQRVVFHPGGRVYLHSNCAGKGSISQGNRCYIAKLDKRINLSLVLNNRGKLQTTEAKLQTNAAVAD